MQYSTSWATESPDEAAMAFAPRYPGVQISAVEPGRFRVAASESGDERLSLTSLHWAAAGRAHAQTNSSYAVCDVYEGTVSLTSGAVPLDTSRLVLAPARPVDAAWEGAHRVRAVRVEQEALDAFAREHFASPTLTVAFTGSNALSATHEALWRAVERHIREDVAAHPEHLHNDLIWDAARRHLMATMLSVFPNTTLDAAPARDGARALPASVRRAVAYMEEHLAEPVSLADLARAARLSPRGLLSAFHRVLETTPTQHLRLLRLEAAHNELLVADPADGHTVAAIAARWGFAHPARFAERYRDRFGENPSVTLRR
jgi:AraC-like DNA-binding protein